MSFMSSNAHKEECWRVWESTFHRKVLCGTKHVSSSSEGTFIDVCDVVKFWYHKDTNGVALEKYPLNNAFTHW